MFAGRDMLHVTAIHRMAGFVRGMDGFQAMQSIRSSDPAAAARPTSGQGSAARNPVVFIVDDDDAVRDSLKLLLEIHGLAVEDFGSTEDFARGFRRPPCGCLVLDQHLPVTSGLDFLASPAGRELGIPVILVTGRGDDGLRARAREMGVLAYLDKPVADEALLAAIGRAVGGAPGPGRG
jgi:two-component system response regulator FixJ